MTIGDKITATCTTLVVMTAALGTVALVTAHRAGSITDAIVTDAMPGIYYIGKVDTVARDIRGRMLTYILSKSPADMDRLDSEIKGFQEQAKGILANYEKTIFRSTDRQMFEKIPPAFDRYMSLWDGVRALSRQSKAQEAYVLYQASVNPAFEELHRVVAAEIDQNKNYADECSAAAASASAAARWWIWVILSLSLLAGPSLAFPVIRGVKTALKQSAKALGEGADQVASAAAEIASASHSLAQGASEQASSLEETSASTQEISAMTRQNAENSRTAAEGMGRAERKVQEANRTLDDMIASMGQINESSQKISKIIKVIDEIAFQTNILALNAAVEAARAGEAGMGFAVVADEVRNLAQRSAQAAKDTAALIEESVTKSSEGSTKLNSVADAIRGITEEATKVKTLVDEVTAASSEQSRGMDQISKAIGEMERVTQKNAASSEQSASASEELAAQAETVKHVVNQLRALVERDVKESHTRAVQVAKKAPTAAPVALSKAVSRRGGPVASAEHEIPFDDAAFKEM